MKFEVKLVFFYAKRGLANLILAAFHAGSLLFTGNITFVYLTPIKSIFTHRFQYKTSEIIKLICGKLLRMANIGRKRTVKKSPVHKLF